MWHTVLSHNDCIPICILGKGTKTLKDCTQYTGTWIQGELNGHGTYSAGTDVTKKLGMLNYTGEFYNNKMHGKGTLKKESKSGVLTHR